MQSTLPLAVATCAPLTADPLHSWAETDARARIVDFVERVTGKSLTT